MAADIVPIRLGLTKGDLYTLWAPRWRDAGDEWEAFLGKDDDLFAFESVADLVAFVRTDRDNDLTDHPAWEAMTEASAHKFDPAEDHQHDLVGVAELVAEKPTEESVESLRRTLAIASTIGSVCELPAVSKFFNGNPVLGSVGGGIDAFTGRSGRKRWAEIVSVIGRSLGQRGRRHRRRSSASPTSTRRPRRRRRPNWSEPPRGRGRRRRHRGRDTRNRGRGGIRDRRLRRRVRRRGGRRPRRPRRWPGARQR